VKYPNLKHKEKGLEKKNSRRGKVKRAHIAWEDNDISSSCSLKEDEEANLCLTDRDQVESSNVYSCKIVKIKILIVRLYILFAIQIPRKIVKQ